VAGLYTGSFILAVGCSTTRRSAADVYAQRTVLRLTPTAIQRVGYGRNAVRQVRTFSGTLLVAGTPDATGRALGCQAYQAVFSLRGTS
jgi:hypothetical protein